ncbi:sideroflexin-2 isoform X2 [Gallus gallus]|uniref:sideroflexin-2 isoform X2 n=1 Tax=Gallus gallus TaxID=9031 RepID=UPI0003506B63|nr:sideroflexin-2 isoform X2 [Gallus gallus]XP_046776731.1 sideroflexin-2 isoform X2 [Gallus gallus]XP_046776732.1 sideroflexin-2 isoform X2 [Gallus gallus]XP_046776733.1 sideroflexin-2 isoform X2 [Gallus gallus]XP_046799259.1 sideroflexin-2 isoform X2 [Gallus gallus]XP_046799260.1 sideroflexin-2 isoform X2 [Gallus gallus]XP_046799261.1 sideroflexin-2 isoform X2 [Gallus gallus]XP_046799262.1 sideroflexin-2 isoform X2 [Gallus gallus]|eukprot:XP_004942300.1 sideroflexin-2 isoform X2 [Gallus gallus]
MAAVPLGFDIDAPRWDQSTFMGRLRHFLNITDPRTVLVPERELDRAQAVVAGCRAGMVPPGSSQEQLLYAKKLYDSAFHPDSGEKMNLIGRMSFQVPGGMAITGFMLQFYRTVPAVVFWQWVNQSFNAIVNYTNRNAASPISLAVLFYISMHLLQITRQIGVAYVTATTTALATAVGLNLYTKRAPPLLARWVPFAAVAAANCVNIPMMRQQEIIRGISVTDEDNNELGHSRRAAVKGIAQVVVSRITMAAPGMIILPIIMERLEKLPFMQRIRVLHAPLQVLLCGGFLLFMVPAACALFPQRCSLALADLEPELRDSIVAKHGDKVPYVYFNKGL